MMPPHVSEWLKGRGVSEAVAQDAGLSWDGSSVVIPLGPGGGNKYRRDPRKSGGLKYWQDKGNRADIYGRGLLASAGEAWVTEGELDALRLRSLGLVAVSPTSGAGTWKDEWTPLFAGKDVYVWYDMDEAGRKGGRKVAKEIARPAARVWLVSHDPSFGKDLTDYLKRRKLSTVTLLPIAVPAPRPDPPAFRPTFPSSDRPPMLSVLDRYAVRHGSPRREMQVKCPFHEDKTASMSVNTEKNLWNCFACGVGGDSWSFVMRMEGCGFLEAKRMYGIM